MLRPKRQSSSTITVTAPIGGWNAVTQLAAMSPNEAVVIDNWFCLDRKSTRLNSSHSQQSRMPSSA